MPATSAQFDTEEFSNVVIIRLEDDHQGEIMIPLKDTIKEHIRSNFHFIASDQFSNPRIYWDIGGEIWVPVALSLGPLGRL